MGRRLLAIAPFSLAAVLALSACEGPRGPQGSEGRAGAPGEPGSDGDPGARGPTGPAGATGAPGATGEPGTPGSPGISAKLVGPGLVLEVVSARLGADGGPIIEVKITDEDGRSLDREGIATEGAVDISLYAAVLDAQADGGSYVPLTTATVTGPDGGTFTQPAPDQGGAWRLVDSEDGTYEYAFATPVGTVDTDATYSIGVDALRTFQAVTYVANGVAHFDASGGAATVERDVVETAACNRCHVPLRAHNGLRRDVNQCELCHTAGLVDPETGNSLELESLIHKLHMGSSLPSVVAGGDFQIVGEDGLRDFSTTRFPGTLGNCDTCHTGSQGERFHTDVSRANCTVCHDLTAFTIPIPPNKLLHTGGAQPNDTGCVVCHPSDWGVAGVMDKHFSSGRTTPGRLASGTHEFPALAINSVTDAQAGKAPKIRFTATLNGTPSDILAQPWPYLAATIAGPTSDFETSWTRVIQGAGASGDLVAIDAPNGVFEYTFAAGSGISADATGTYGIALEGYHVAGTEQLRHEANNPILYVDVGGGTPETRRAIVETARCDSCHQQLTAHGGVRSNVEYCAFCHTGDLTNDNGVGHFEDTKVLSPSLNLDVMVHRIHRGTALEQPYVLGSGAPTEDNPAGTPNDYSTVRFPSDLRNCQLCHVSGSPQLPLAPTQLRPTREHSLDCTEAAAADTDTLCEARTEEDVRIVPATTAACTACHDAPATFAHAEIMTTSTGVESCATCHDAQSAYSIDRAHALDP